MASPIITLGTASISPAVPVTTPVTETVMTAQVQQTQQRESTPLSSSPPKPQQDTVKLSSTALNLSKELAASREDQDGQPALENQRIQREPASPVSQKPTDKVEISITKSFPPFMGGADELQQLKAEAPALYRQILRMVVPPPVNISYSDAQLLQRPGVDSHT